MFKVSSALHFAAVTQVPRTDATASESCWTPNADVYVSTEGLVIKVELAGVRREDLELTVHGSQLKISGHRPDGCRGPQCKFLVMEINYGSFESVVEIPPGYDVSRAQAAYQNGFLRVDVPVESRPKSRRRLPVSEPGGPS